MLQNRGVKRSSIGCTLTLKLLAVMYVMHFAVNIYVYIYMQFGILSICVLFCVQCNDIGEMCHCLCTSDVKSVMWSVSYWSLKLSCFLSYWLIIGSDGSTYFAITVLQPLTADTYQFMLLVNIAFCTGDFGGGG